MKVDFIWDPAKNKLNQKKHGVSFEEASTIFHNSPFEVFFDPEHSVEEDRYIAAGFSSQNQCLLVVHYENSSGTVIRIISARKATKNETKKLFGGVKS